MTGLLHPAWLALLCAGLCGCASTATLRGYDGPARPPAELAVLAVPYQLDVLSLDDRPGLSTPLFSTARETQIELLPGSHTLLLRFYSPSDEIERSGSASLFRSDPATLRFQVAAGRLYRLKYTYRTGSAREPNLQVWIEDDAGAALPQEQPPVSHAVSAPPSAPETPLDQLKRWWAAAGEDDRAAFRGWIQ